MILVKKETATHFFTLTMKEPGAYSLCVVDKMYGAEKYTMGDIDSITEVMDGYFHIDGDAWADFRASAISLMNREENRRDEAKNDNEGN